ncbi:MAG: hypothetical protein DRQ88_06670 [Epsilonproteobacteria bacterium]|nr:MAG: hypothetical protein DRQ89_11455 [Campylobacterota bacterium]RLA66397.1 MAG: hypothetical protein DRQ88_06670 [Campylobacterota bacterium]
MFKLYPIIASLLLLSGCGWGKRWFKRVEEVNNFEKVSLNLAKENRFLKLEINNLKNEVHQLGMKNKYAQISAKIGPSREISSIEKDKDLVRFKDYNWTADELLFVAEVEFERDDFNKSSQFYRALIKHYPKYSKIDDKLLFNAAVSSYESKHFTWSQVYFEKLLKEFPNSSFYLSSKLWWALTLYKIGKKRKFYSKLEEFKELYKNTPEWKILSEHYEKIKNK